MSSELKEEDFDWAKKETEVERLYRLYRLSEPKPKEDKRLEIIKKLLACRDSQVELMNNLFELELISEKDLQDQQIALSDNISHLFKLVIDAS